MSLNVPPGVSSLRWILRGRISSRASLPAANSGMFRSMAFLSRSGRNQSGSAFNRHSPLIMRSPGPVMTPPSDGGQPIPDDLDHELEPVALELPPAVDHEPQETHHFIDADTSPELACRARSVAT